MKLKLTERWFEVLSVCLPSAHCCRKEAKPACDDDDDEAVFFQSEHPDSLWGRYWFVALHRIECRWSREGRSTC